MSLFAPDVEAGFFFTTFFLASFSAAAEAAGVPAVEAADVGETAAAGSAETSPSESFFFVFLGCE